MEESIEQIDSAALFLVTGRSDLAEALVAEHRGRFEEELKAQEANITEEGEGEATATLRRLWVDYLGKFDRYRALSTPREMQSAYFGELLPAFSGVKAAAARVLDINQDGMLRRSDAAQHSARRYHLLLLSLALGGSALGLWASTSLISRLLRPVQVLAQASRRIGEGDLATRARVEGKDEIAELAREFNTMAERLQRYRDSSLGELLEAQQASQATIESLPDPVLVLDVEGRLQHHNQAAETLLRLRPDLGGGDVLASAEPSVQALVQRVHQHVTSGKGMFAPKSLEDAVRVSTPEGDRHFLPRASPVYAEEGNVAGTTLVLQDVTRLLRFDELKNNLVATVAHEFRTPLTSLRMAIHLCTEQAVGPLTEKQADLLFAAREDCERLQSIVDELLDLSRIQSGRIELRTTELDPETIVRTAVDAQRGAAAKRKVDLRSEALPGIDHVVADPDRIQLVLANLLTNAIRHSPEGAAVVVRVKASGAKVRFEVIDQGPGVPREYREAIFEKYFRAPGAPGGGAGLGLFISQEIVQAHGGQIGVEGEPGRATTFWFTLPASLGAADAGKG
jgi:signal transduction histidine kinase